MPRSKVLVFEKNEIDLSAERATKAFVIKVFHLYTRRNEWVNLDGDTSLVNRAWARFNMSFQESTDAAEKQRTQGTKFLIDEAPAICVMGKRYSQIVTELFTENPLSRCERLITNGALTFQEVESTISTT